MKMQTDIGYLVELRDDLLEAAWSERLERRVKRPRRRQRRLLIAAAAVLVVVGSIATGYRMLRPSERMTAGPASGRVENTLDFGGDVKREELGIVHRNPGTQPGDDHSLSGNANLYPGGAFQPIEQQASAAGPTNGAGPMSVSKVIKTAGISLVVKQGGFAAAVQQATDIAAKNDGYVQSSSSGKQEGSLVLRVPSAHFESTLGALRSLGSVEHESIKGQDVTAEFVDLNARLKIAQSREAALLRLMDKASSVSQILSLQRTLNDAQLNVEQIKGALRVLRSKASEATITVALREQGAPSPGSSVHTPSVGLAIRRALSGFVSVVAAGIVGFGYLLPVLAVVGVGWLLVRRRRRGQA